MRPRLDERAAVTLAFLGVALLFLGFTLRLGPVARRVPLVVACATVALLAVLAARDLGTLRARGGDGGSLLPRELSLGATLLLLAALVAVVGAVPAVTLVILLYLRLFGRERWRSAATFAAATGIVAHALFAQLLGLRVYDGALWRWFGSVLR